MHISMPSTSLSLRHYLSGIAIVFVLVAISACSPENVKTTAAASQDTEKRPAVEITEQYQAALTALENNDEIKAESILLDLTHNQPYMSGPYFNLALIQLKQGRYEESLKTIDRVITLDGKIAQAYNLRAQIYIQNGMIKNAENDYLKALELDENYTNAHYNIALLYDIYYQDIRKAITHYEKYLSLLERPDKATVDWINHLKGSLNHG